MIRITIPPFEVDSADDASAIFQQIAEEIEDGEKEVEIFLSDDKPVLIVTVEDLCEYCDGTGEITSGEYDDITTKKCFNCNEPQYDND